MGTPERSGPERGEGPRAVASRRAVPGQGAGQQSPNPDRGGAGTIRDNECFVRNAKLVRQANGTS